MALPTHRSAKIALLIQDARLIKDKTMSSFVQGQSIGQNNQGKNHEGLDVGEEARHDNNDKLSSH